MSLGLTNPATSHAPPHPEMWVDPMALVVVKYLAIAHIGPSQGDADDHNCTNTMHQMMT